MRCVSLVMVLCLVVLYAVGVQWGITSECCRPDLRLGYIVSHVGWVHLLMNCWCLLCIVYGYGISVGDAVVAIIAAATVPTVCLTAEPTMGMSGVLFALMGILTLRVRRKLYFATWCMGYIVLGLLMPGVNGWLHAWCYTMGLAWGAVNYRFKC